MYSNKKIFVLGMGKSGVAVSKLLCRDNYVLLTDVKCDDRCLIDELEQMGINVVITENQDELLNEHFDYVVKNPGVFPDNKTVKKALRLNIPIINEVEVAYNLLPEGVKIIGITGSNGKTTTTMLIYEILKMADLSVWVAGNIGIPFCDVLPNVKSGDIVVLEVSSHQLVNIDKFSSDVSIITNLSEVHLDMFGTYDNYKNNKSRIFMNQSKCDRLILNGNDEDVVKLALGAKSKKIYFNSASLADICIVDNFIVYHGENICELSDIRIKGVHNYENVMCAIAACKEFGVDNVAIKEALNNFAGAEHRIEFVRKLNDRKFYNDSKATNNTSTIVALSSFDEPVILLLGGFDRGQSFDALKDYMSFVKMVICYGQTKYKINDFCVKNGISVMMVDDLREATKFAYNVSDEGDVILLSPACASNDQFDSFEHRGKFFKEIVEDLK